MCYNPLVPFALLDLGAAQALYIWSVEHDKGQMRIIVPLMEEKLPDTLSTEKALVILVVGATAPTTDK
jgi:hypothetical protein